MVDDEYVPRLVGARYKSDCSILLAYLDERANVEELRVVDLRAIVEARKGHFSYDLLSPLLEPDVVRGFFWYRDELCWPGVWCFDWIDLYNISDSVEGKFCE
jgi:hypothetical protein